MPQSLSVENEMTTASEVSGARLFPADELGIPLSIYIPSKYRNEDGHLDKSSYQIDKHHRFAPKKRLIHKEGEIGKVLRYSCLQFVPQELHTLFNRFYKEPKLPETRVEKFGALFLSLARYLPAEAIDVSGDTPIREELTPQERHLIWSNNELRPEQGSKIQREVLDYVTKQNVTGMDEVLVEEFLSTINEERRIALGRILFRRAAEVAVEPIEKVYVEAWEGGLLPRQDVRPENVRPIDIVQARAVPKKPTLFVARHVINRYNEIRAINRLHDNLLIQIAA